MLSTPTQLLIDGRWQTSHTGRTFPVTDPATDKPLAEVADAGPEDVRTAVRAASAALPSWRSLPAAERATVLHRAANRMLERQDELAALLTAEQGKPLAEARSEIAYAASFLTDAAEEGKRVLGDIVPSNRSDQRILVLQQPVGTCAAITPWNFPAAMITRKLGPALAVGCTMLVKPAEQTPLSALALGQILLDAGTPDGVVGILPAADPAPIAEALLNDPTVRKLSFTGSTEVGRALMRSAATNLTRLSLELGGHAPFLVFEDADLDAAVAGAIASKFRNAGQTCICANRFLVQESIADLFISKLSTALDSLRSGPGARDGVHLGPLIDDRAVAKVERHVTDALERGAHIVRGGKRVAVDGCRDRFYAPTLLRDVPTDALCWNEETFGPVAPIRTFTTEAEALALANDSPFGLAAYFYTRDASRLMRLAENLDYGIIGANDSAPSTAQAPFGGIKQSGFGREGGRYGLREYLAVKYVSWGL